MANCSQCGINVGCACTLITGLCVGCYTKNQGEGGVSVQLAKKAKRAIVPQPIPDPPPNTEFMQILENKSLSREEKLARINNILEQARLSINDNQS